MKKRWITLIVITITLFIIILIYATNPQGRSIQGQTYQINENELEFLYDLTYTKNNILTHDHQIFDKTFELIDQAEKFIILDMFLFGITEKPYYRNLTQELTTHLINKKTQNPEIIIYFITDDFNLFNKPHNKPYFNQLEQNNIKIIYTPLTSNNPISKLKRYIFKKTKKRLNHRKVLITDNNNSIISLITSANPHDTSSANSNVALVIKEQIWQDIYKYEKQDAQIDDQELETILATFQKPSLNTNTKVQLLLDAGLMNSLYREIDSTTKDDKINIATFYLSDNKIIDKLIKASNRGTKIKIIFDTNDYFFSQRKFGIPNKPVAEELLKKSDNKIQIRWYESYGEQFHTKLAIINKQTQSTIYLGSSNLVDNNIILYNLQSDVKLTAPNNSTIINDINNYFNRIWNNQDGTFTTDYNSHKDSSILKKLRFEWEQFIRVLQ